MCLIDHLRSVLVVATDEKRREDLARPFSRSETRVIAARNPLEGLWSAPDVDAIVLDREGDADVVQL